MIYGSVCSGIEAATLAWHPLGWRPTFFSEIDPFPRAVLQHHYPAVPLHGDFTTIEATDYEPIDLLVGGTPCQSFSLAGLRGGLDDERGALALEYLRLARRLRPRWLVWENVPGVLSHDDGRTFGAILGGLAELGYGWAYRVLDAQHFGVPQRRARVILVGYLGDWRPAGAVLFERASLRRDPPPRRATPEETAGTLAGGARGRGGYSTDDLPLTAGTLDIAAGGADENDAEQGRLIAQTLYGSDVMPTLLGSHGGTGGVGTTQDQSVILAFGGNRQSGPIDVATAITAHGGPHGRLDFETETFVATTLRARDGAKGVDSDATDTLIPMGFNSREDPCAYGDQSGALGSSSPQAQAVAGRAGVRRLTPRECERLQGFPDDYTAITYRRKPAADGPRYKALGNSMAVPVMAWIGRRIEAVERVAQAVAA